MTDIEKDKLKNGKKSSGETELFNNLQGDVSNAFIPDEVEQKIEEKKSEISNPKIKPDDIDVDGVVFDPELHATDKEGNPSLTKTGKFRKKKGVSSVAFKDAKKVDEVAKDIHAIKMASTAASAMFIQGGCIVFGEEWLPKKEPHDEKLVLDNAFFNYFEAKDIKDFPAGVALCISLFAYSSARFMQPKTSSKLKRVKDGLIGRYFTAKSKRKNKKEGDKNGSYFSFRKNGKREDNVNNEVSEAST